MTEPSAKKEDILTRLRENSEDQVAWQDLYLAFWPFVFAKIFRSLGGNSQQSGELAHDVFTRLARYRHFTRIDSVAKFHNYLGATCENVVNDFYKQTRRYSAICHELNAARQPWIDHSRGDLLKEVLPQVCRRLEDSELLLLDLLLDGATMIEIAGSLHTSTATARVRVWRFRSKLKALVGEIDGSRYATFNRKRMRFS